MSKLLAVTAFCHADAWLAEKRAEYMRSQGYLPTHDLLLIGDSSVSEIELERVEQAYKGVFKEVYGRRIKETPNNQAWPHGCNHVWRITTRIVAGRYGNPKFTPTGYVGWFYFEPDVTPLNPQFMGILEQQYRFHKKPFLGYVGPVKVKTTIPQKNGQAPTVRESMVDHMNGAGVYPISTAYYSRDALAHESLPWDVAGLAGNELLKIARVPADVYLMGFRSKNFKKTGEKTFEGVREKINQVGTDEPYPLDISKAILHHGCKDGSLMDAIVGVPEASTIKPPVLSNEPFAYSVSQVQMQKEQALRHEVIGAIKHEKTYEILADHAAGMNWKDLISKYKIAPKVLKSILPPRT